MWCIIMLEVALARWVKFISEEMQWYSNSLWHSSNDWLILMSPKCAFLTPLHHLHQAGFLFIHFFYTKQVSSMYSCCRCQIPTLPYACLSRNWHSLDQVMFPVFKSAVSVNLSSTASASEIHWDHIFPIPMDYVNITRSCWPVSAWLYVLHRSHMTGWLDNCMNECS